MSETSTSSVTSVSGTPKEKAQKRLRGPHVNSIIAAAAKTGLLVSGATIKPGGVIELKFAQSGAPPAEVNEWDDPR
jgi:hypothetical protein